MAALDGNYREFRDVIRQFNRRDGVFSSFPVRDPEAPLTIDKVQEIAKWLYDHRYEADVVENFEREPNLKVFAAKGFSNEMAANWDGIVARDVERRESLARRMRALFDGCCLQ